MENHFSNFPIFLDFSNFSNFRVWELFFFTSYASPILAWFRIAPRTRFCLSSAQIEFFPQDFYRDYIYESYKPLGNKIERFWRCTAALGDDFHSGDGSAADHDPPPKRGCNPPSQLWAQFSKNSQQRTARYFTGVKYDHISGVVKVYFPQMRLTLKGYISGLRRS